jgi:hypothetical protein
MTGHIRYRRLPHDHQRSPYGQVVGVFNLGERTVQAFGENHCMRHVTGVFEDLRRDETTAATVAPPVVSAFDTQIGGLDHG